MNRAAVKRVAFLVLALFFFLQTFKAFDFVSPLVVAFFVKQNHAYNNFLLNLVYATVGIVGVFAAMKIAGKMKSQSAVGKKTEDSVASAEKQINPIQSRYFTLYFVTAFLLAIVAWGLIVVLRTTFDVPINEYEILDGFSVFYLLLFVFFLDQAFGLSQKYAPDFNPNRKRANCSR